ncbi:ligand-effect modulator 3 LEM3 family protein, putative [Ichthyophthirius multifiliis]|uniref:Ligand-effect modulator 3 LEM3 family protein, putative n=1 Tax=Ichthyophthirius multifiliis TaxID=5932 RepID=G0QTG3_ICHMU|nr:ligand-effect modulator 3 LEM3 family protein, putative [Ichthyophthirius multifiliis]EGR31497.1 ligand-effect modulator 3 LEM3 family protein, putative [Ichthyophthirius multifiliis]|eukprot:XP_004034983.1 ligand-effect modulator 3 LEM3 family protein, putative [Ichthyophthirius multifiliis]
MGNEQNKYWIDPENEHFIVWMQISGLPKFKKIWGRIENDLDEGNYELKVQNKYNIKQYKGHKSLLFTNSSILGGKNEFLAYGYVVIGTILNFISLIFYIKGKRNGQEFINIKNMEEDEDLLEEDQY